MFIVLYFTLTLQRGVFGLEISYNNLFIIHVLLQLRCNILNNSEAFTSELLVNIEEIFHRHYMHSDILCMLKSSITSWCVPHE